MCVEDRRYIPQNTNSYLWVLSVNGVLMGNFYFLLLDYYV